MDFKTRFATAASIGSLLFATLLPGAAFADVNVDITNNGADSNNSVNVNVNTSVNVTQSNSFNVTLGINSTADTGNNTASNNTGGGDVSIFTGNATSNVSVNISGGSNVANISNCGCNQTVNTSIADNGAGSDNTVNVTKKHPVVAAQTNTGSVTGNVRSRARTGRNRANNNTGGGNVTIDTLDAVSNVTTNVTAPSNTLNVTP